MANEPLTGRRYVKITEQKKKIDWALFIREISDKHKDVGKAYEYFLKGITTKEIAKLQKVSLRTVQRWKVKYQFEQLATVPTPQRETIQKKAVRMANAGLSYSKIGKRLKKCKATIYNYIRQERGRQPETVPDVYQPLFDYLANEFNILPLRSEMDSIIRLAGEVSETEISILGGRK